MTLPTWSPDAPIVEWGVAEVELITGKDLVPDKGRPWYGGLQDNWNWL